MFATRQSVNCKGNIYMALDREMKDTRARIAYVRIRLAEIGEERKKLNEERKQLTELIKASAAKKPSKG